VRESECVCVCMCMFIRGWVAKIYDQNAADNIRIFYGAYIYICILQFMCVCVCLCM